MEKVDIYYKVENNTVIDINTNKIDEKYNGINAETIDEFFRKLGNLKIEDPDIEKQLNEYFDDVETNDSFNIKHWISNRSFGELIDMYENNEIKKPEMQREFVWDSIKSSRLIESIVMGLPIPPLFLLEIKPNIYEIIDGFQRLTTIFNYVNGRPWYENPGISKSIPSKLSSKLVIKEIRGKKFDDLDPEFKRMIKRSTVPLIEFKQLDPKDHNSKYLIFERINTGSVKLNPMQIRKSLAHGRFIKDLYKYGNKNDKFKKLFSVTSLRKDLHIETFLRVIVMGEIYKGTYINKSTGIKNILNEYCEDNKENQIEDGFYMKFDGAIEKSYEIFKNNELNIFKKVNSLNDGQFKTIGSVNTGILEAMVNILMYNDIKKNNIEIYNDYCRILYDVNNNSGNGNNKNPFSVSTGTNQAIKHRFKILEEILGIHNE